MVVLERPGGMRRGAGGIFGGFVICRLRLAELALGLDSARRAMPTARAADRSAHSAGPGKGKRDEGRGERYDIRGKR